MAKIIISPDHNSLSVIIIFIFKMQKPLDKKIVNTAFRLNDLTHNKFNLDQTNYSYILFL